MKKNNTLDNHIKAAAEQFAAVNSKKYSYLYEHPMLKDRVVRLLELLRGAMYPGLFGGAPCEADKLAQAAETRLRAAAELLFSLHGDVLPNKEDEYIGEITEKYIESLLGIAEDLQTDIRAAYEGDPAATCEAEIMLSYPAFEAISIYRLAHGLYRLGVPIIPRIMTEYAHGRTGIDIHPGAKIGKYFFIDHGTGVVIGETCTIGDRVKLYQGVTLGAKSFELDENGNPVKGVKRHPDIGNNVIIYANATILGGRTTIGDNCIIGGSVWLTHSVEAGKTIYNSGT